MEDVFRTHCHRALGEPIDTEVRSHMWTDHVLTLADRAHPALGTRGVDVTVADLRHRVEVQAHVAIECYVSTAPVDGPHMVSMTTDLKDRDGCPGLPEHDFHREHQSPFAPPIGDLDSTTCIGRRFDDASCHPCQCRRLEIFTTVGYLIEDGNVFTSGVGMERTYVQFAITRPFAKLNFVKLHITLSLCY
ncbi:hypothetical protein D3C86_1491470 [compost metagenome]